MATVNKAQIEQELVWKLSNPHYRSTLNQLLAQRNTYKWESWNREQKLKAYKDPHYKPVPFEEYVIGTLAHDAVEDAFGDTKRPKIIDPIYVAQLQPTDQDFWLYRMHDGNSGFRANPSATASNTSGTLGGWWCNRQLLARIWRETAGESGQARQELTFKFLRSAMFIHPDWNRGTMLARMSIPPGYCIPAIVGRGSWEAMKVAPNTAVDPNRIQIRDVHDVENLFGLNRMPEARQFYLPLFDDKWVTQISSSSDKWPFEPR